MSFLTPAGWAKRCTMQRSGPGVHQIRFVQAGAGRGWAVTCTCRDGDAISHPSTIEQAWADWNLFHLGVLP